MLLKIYQLKKADVVIGDSNDISAEEADIGFMETTSTFEIANSNSTF